MESLSSYMKAMPNCIDSHAHLYFDRFDEDRDDVIARAREAGFEHIINIGIDAETSVQALSLAKEYPGFCYATAGLHPNNAEMPEEELENVLEGFRELFRENPDELRAVGEIGLDYYWDHATPTAQARALRAQLDLARDLDRPVVIHCRDALEDCLPIIEEYHEDVRGVFHCFAGSAEQARRVVELGWYVSYAGNVTFPKARDLAEAARGTPPDRLLLETDAPFLAPQAVRGKRCEPVHALHTCAFLADIHDMTVDELAAITTRNTRELFTIPSK